MFLHINTSNQNKITLYEVIFQISSQMTGLSDFLKDGKQFLNKKHQGTSFGDTG